MTIEARQTGAAPADGRPRRGALQLYDALRDDILWLRIAPGSGLDEVAIARRFGVSRTPVREALLLLAGERLVHFLVNRTTIVAPLSLANLGDYFDTYLLLSRAVVRSAALARERDSQWAREDLDAVERALADRDAERCLRADLALRRKFAHASGNIFQSRFFDQILDAGIRTKVMHYFPNATRVELRQAHGALCSLVAAVEEGDAEASDRAVSALIEAEAEIVVRALKPKVAATMVLHDAARPWGAR